MAAGTSPQLRGDDVCCEPHLQHWGALMRYGAHSRMEGALPPPPRSPPLYPCDDCGGAAPTPPLLRRATYPHIHSSKSMGACHGHTPRCVGTNVRQVHRAPCIATATAPACTPFSYIIKQHSMQQNAPLHPTIEKSHENTRHERDRRENTDHCDITTNASVGYHTHAPLLHENS